MDLQTAIDLDATTNERVVLRRRPEGLLSKDDVELEDGVALPELADGEALIEVGWLGVDATVRTWLSKAEGYLPAVEIGETVRASGIGRVVATRCETFPLGDFVYGLPGWQRYGVVRDDPLATHLGGEVDAPAMLSVYGATGLTAYVGVVDIGKADAGQTVVVSAAAGATGSLAAQIAKIRGCRVIGICGSAEKARWLVDDLGLDGAINHRVDDVPGPAQGALPRPRRRLLRQRRRPDPRRRPRSPGHARPGRAVRSDRHLQRARPPPGPVQLLPAHQPPGPDGGLPVARSLGPLR